jgi:vacuolar-type H+-ATPase subunit I/STV1
MPLPTPNNRESRGDFVSRCIQSLSDKGEMKDNNQRIAVCYSQWKDAKASADAIVGSEDQETLIYSAQRFSGKKRSDLKNSDFLYPEERSFPIVTPKDVKDAVSSFGRSKGKDFEEFKRRLVRKARSKGAEFVSALPDTIKEQFKIKANIEESIEELREEYVNQAKTVIRELLSAANKVAAFLEDEAYHDKATEAWVFEKMVLSKAMICGAEHYIEFGEDEDEDEDETQDSTETIGLIEPAKIVSEDEIRQKVYDNKFGADTY